MPVQPKPLWCGPPARHDRIRVAYLSADFHRHATAYLIAELFELHDHARFEFVGVSFDRDESSEVRRRLVKSLDAFHDVRTRSDHDVAKLLHELEIDIAVDLKGHTGDSRRPDPGKLSGLSRHGWRRLHRLCDRRSGRHPVRACAVLR
jgi:hypothetical protein